MKLASYIADGAEAFGVVSGDGVVTMNKRFGGTPPLREALAAGLLAADREAARTPSPTTSFPTSNSCRSFPIRTRSSAPASTTARTPPRPAARCRSSRACSSASPNTLVGHEGEMIRPTVSTNFDFEGELTIVIGRGGRHIPSERALDHVAGYTCFVDGSVRDYQKFSVTSGKNFPGTGPLGPWIVTTDEIPDPTQAHADDAAQRQRDAALRHRHADLFDPADHRLLLRLHHARRPATSSPPARPRASATAASRRSG